MVVRYRFVKVDGRNVKAERILSHSLGLRSFLGRDQCCCGENEGDAR